MFSQNVMDLFSNYYVLPVIRKGLSTDTKPALTAGKELFYATDTMSFYDYNGIDYRFYRELEYGLR